VTLCDAGPLVAIINEGDPYHAQCVAALVNIPPGEMMTTWPCVTEAMHLLGRHGGSRAQQALWGYIADGLVRLYDPLGEEWQRMRSLMTQYGDTPMDLADASLVAAAERLGTSRVFTMDQHFRAYRIYGRYAFDVLN
jgi:uncharacterized protein